MNKDSYADAMVGDAGKSTDSWDEGHRLCCLVDLDFVVQIHSSVFDRYRCDHSNFLPWYGSARDVLFTYVIVLSKYGGLFPNQTNSEIFFFFFTFVFFTIGLSNLVAGTCGS